MAKTNSQHREFWPVAFEIYNKIGSALKSGLSS
jgi:hypothetical protein